MASLDIFHKTYDWLEHHVGGKVLHAAGDVEGHLGTDDKFYLIDLARSFPPEDVRQCTHLAMRPSAIFYRLMRPELLNICKERQMPSLSPDAISGWSNGQMDAAVHNKNLSLVTEMLLNELIPACSRVRQR